MSSTWSPQATVMIVRPPAKLSMPGLPPPFPAPLFPAPPLALALPLGVPDPPPQAAIASAPTNMNTALARSPIDMLYLQPRKVHMQVMLLPSRPLSSGRCQD
jgi:hypothetical protein